MYGDDWEITIGQLIECLASKLGAITGNLTDGTPFTHDSYSIESMTKELEKLGFNAYGNAPI